VDCDHPEALEQVLALVRIATEGQP
jgi:hypothetical protein